MYNKDRIDFQTKLAIFLHMANIHNQHIYFIYNILHIITDLGRNKLFLTFLFHKLSSSSRYSRQTTKLLFSSSLETLKTPLATDMRISSSS